MNDVDKDIDPAIKYSSKYPSLVSPTEAYNQAFNSPVYRLSELMFGSLLASYVLGFISFASSTAFTYKDAGVIRYGEDVIAVLLLLLERSPYFFVSVTFAYITAGFYVSYHAGILTMHHMPLDHLKYDFLIALSHAALFGISMIYPMAFPFLLSGTLIVAIFRQRQEHKNLVGSFYKLMFKNPNNDGDARTLQKRNDETLESFNLIFNATINDKKYEMFSVWRKIPFNVFWACLVLILIGGLSWWSVAYWGDHIKNYVTGSSTFLIFVISAIYIHKRILGKRADLLYREIKASLNQDDPSNNGNSTKIPGIDSKFYELIGEIENKLSE